MELSGLGLCSQHKPSWTVQHYRQGHVDTLAYDSFVLSFINMSEPRFWMLFPLESWTLLLEGRVRLWVTGEYCYMTRVIQLPQDQANNITVVGFRSRTPPFLYSYESEMHAVSKQIWRLSSKHKTFLSRALITNLQYFCQKLTWKTSLSEALTLDADSAWGMCDRECCERKPGMLEWRMKLAGGEENS